MYVLYHMGRQAADQSFATWLEHNSSQLEALTLSCNWDSNDSTDLVLEALADAAAAAQAAGRPLQLHTLRVLGTEVELGLMIELLAVLPHLRGLQVALHHTFRMDSAARHLGARVRGVLRPLGLQKATQLQHLHLYGQCTGYHVRSGATVHILPRTLQRLSLIASSHHQLPDLTDLTGCTALQLAGNTAANLPPGLQELQLSEMRALPAVLLEHQHVLTAWHGYSRLPFAGEQQQMSSFTSLRAITLGLDQLLTPAVTTAVASHASLCSLRLFTADRNATPGRMQAAFTAAAAIKRLRCLELCLGVYNVYTPTEGVLTALTGLTRLLISMGNGDDTMVRTWTEEVGRMAGLRWLSVSTGLLAAGWAWLKGMQQLRVLVVECMGASYADGSWLQGCTRDSLSSHEVLPPQLQVLGVSGMSAQRAAAWQLRRRLVQVVGTSECEVVVGVHLDCIHNLALQLAGLPEGLQQLLV
jgi:hypothetical protein